jgi:hypothetical protein
MNIYVYLHVYLYTYLPTQQSLAMESNSSKGLARQQKA